MDNGSVLMDMLQKLQSAAIILRIGTTFMKKCDYYKRSRQVNWQKIPIPKDDIDRSMIKINFNVEETIF